MRSSRSSDQGYPGARPHPTSADPLSAETLPGRPSSLPGCHPPWRFMGVRNMERPMDRLPANHRQVGEGGRAFYEFSAFTASFNHDDKPQRCLSQRKGDSGGRGFRSRGGGNVLPSERPRRQGHAARPRGDTLTPLQLSARRWRLTVWVPEPSKDLNSLFYLFIFLAAIKH